MGMDNIFAILIAAAGFLWTVVRDKTKDIDSIVDRIATIEGKVMQHSTDIERLEREQGELEDSIQSLQEQIHKMDLKIERILTILENNKGL